MTLSVIAYMVLCRSLLYAYVLQRQAFQERCMQHTQHPRVIVFILALCVQVMLQYYM